MPVKNKIVRTLLVVFKKIDHRIITYLTFVAISSIFWLLNKLGEEFTTNLNYPVQFINLPANKVLISDLPKELNLNVSGTGYAILRHKTNPGAYPVIIDLSSYSEEMSKPGLKSFSLVTRYEKEAFNTQFGNSLTVNEVLPERLLFKFANIVSKKIKVEPTISLELERQYMLDGQISSNPDSVLVEGPKSILDTFKLCYTKPIKTKPLKKTTQKKVEISEVEYLRFTPDEVMLNIPVSEFTEGTVHVEIIVVNTPDSIELKTFPRFVDVSFNASITNFGSLGPDDFRVEVDYLDLNVINGGKLPVRMVLSPVQVKILGISPALVEFMLERK